MADFRSHLTAYIQKEAQPREKYGHQPRLYALTREIGKNLSYDDDIVFAAVWLHDLGVFTGHRPEDPDELSRWDNTAYAMTKAPELLLHFGFPTEKISAVVEAIRTHQPSGQPQSLEAEILRDADILEQLGAIGACRTLCKIGRDTRFPDFTSAAASLWKAVGLLPPQLRLKSARPLAVDRVRTLRAFLESLETEAANQLG